MERKQAKMPQIGNDNIIFTITISLYFSPMMLKEKLRFMKTIFLSHHFPLEIIGLSCAMVLSELP